MSKVIVSGQQTRKTVNAKKKQQKPFLKNVLAQPFPKFWLVQ